VTVEYEVVEMRCDVNPRRLFGKLLVAQKELGVPAPVRDGLVEFSCRDCQSQRKATDPTVSRVLHRFNLLAELAETVVERSAVATAGVPIQR
jgi:hypothetical protein